MGFNVGNLDFGVRARLETGSLAGVDQALAEWRRKQEQNPLRLRIAFQAPTNSGGGSSGGSGGPTGGTGGAHLDRLRVEADFSDFEKEWNKFAAKPRTLKVRLDLSGADGQLDRLGGTGSSRGSSGGGGSESFTSSVGSSVVSGYVQGRVFSGRNSTAAGDYRAAQRAGGYAAAIPQHVFDTLRSLSAAPEDETGNGNGMGFGGIAQLAGMAISGGGRMGVRRLGGLLGKAGMGRAGLAAGGVVAAGYFAHMASAAFRTEREEAENVGLAERYGTNQDQIDAAINQHQSYADNDVLTTLVRGASLGSLTRREAAGIISKTGMRNPYANVDTLHDKNAQYRSENQSERRGADLAISGFNLLSSKGGLVGSMASEDARFTGLRQSTMEQEQSAIRASRGTPQETSAIHATYASIWHNQQAEHQQLQDNIRFEAAVFRDRNIGEASALRRSATGDEVGALRERFESNMSNDTAEAFMKYGPSGARAVRRRLESGFANDILGIANQRRVESTGLATDVAAAGMSANFQNYAAEGLQIGGGALTGIQADRDPTAYGIYHRKQLAALGKNQLAGQIAELNLLNQPGTGIEMGIQSSAYTQMDRDPRHSPENIQAAIRLDKQMQEALGGYDGSIDAQKKLQDQFGAFGVDMSGAPAGMGVGGNNEASVALLSQIASMLKQALTGQ